MGSPAAPRRAGGPVHDRAADARARRAPPPEPAASAPPSLIRMPCEPLIWSNAASPPTGKDELWVADFTYVPTARRSSGTAAYSAPGQPRQPAPGRPPATAATRSRTAGLPPAKGLTRPTTTGRSPAEAPQAPPAAAAAASPPPAADGAAQTAPTAATPSARKCRIARVRLPPGPARVASDRTPSWARAVGGDVDHRRG